MRDVKGYEGLYAITSCGKVWSYRRKKFLTQIPDKDGYMKVNLYKDDKMKTFLVHRLVAIAYIPNSDNLPEVNHKNEIKNRNYVNNLEWCNHGYNINYGERNRKAAEKRARRKIAGLTVREVAEKTGKPIPSIYWEIRKGWDDERILAC